LRFLTCLYAITLVVVTAAFSEIQKKAPRRRQISKPLPSLQVTLQSCFTPESILENIAVSLTPEVDFSGAVASLTLVRLSKQLISLENRRNNIHGEEPSLAEDLIIKEKDKQLWNDGLKNVVTCLTSSNWMESQKSLEALVEGIKSASVISRLLPKCQGLEVGAAHDVNGIYNLWWKPLFEKIIEEDDRLAAGIQPHQLSGLKWSVDCFRLSVEDVDIEYRLPQSLQRAYDDLGLPFTVRPGFLTQNSNTPTVGNEGEGNMFNVPAFVTQVDFRSETIQTKSKRAVVERRQTAWQGDDHVPPFEYSGKAMERMQWSEVVSTVRDLLFDETSHYYDCCLLNLYPDGGSGMRYHIDPDQGVKWGFETVVVSIGATRRFAFRSIPDTGGRRKGADDSKPHSFVLMDGDVTEMIRDCQKRFQHTVKTSEVKGESSPRVSLVFKKTLGNYG